MKIEIEKHIKEAHIVFVLAVLLITFLANANAFSTHPEVGKPVPEFALQDIGNYHIKQVSSAGLQGKFVILDFWNKGCVSCVQSFPKINDAHSIYKGKVEIILVGTEQEGIQEMFEKFKSRLNLKFPYAFNDQLYKQFVPAGAPHLVWIDNNGIVKAITTGVDFVKKNIDAFISGQEFKFKDTSHKAIANELTFDFQRPYLIGGNGGNPENFLYRSLLEEYRPDMPLKTISSIDNPPRVLPYGSMAVHEGIGSLRELYTVAYTGKLQWRYGDSLYNIVYPKIILEMADSSMFHVDRETGKGYYMYSLILPKAKATTESFMSGMQRDLEFYFGYKARLETRTLPCWILTASPDTGERLKTKGGTKYAQGNYGAYKATNQPINSLFRRLFTFNNYWENKTLPILNKTGIEGNIDVDIIVNTTDWSDVQRTLRSLGFSLVKSTNQFKVLVISD